MQPQRRVRRSRRPHGPDHWDRLLSADQVPEHRHLACGLYTICLDVVVKRQWVSFTCRTCSLWPSNRVHSPQEAPAPVLPFTGQEKG